MTPERVTAARRAAYEVVRRVFEEGAWADRALPAALRRNSVDDADRGFAQRLAFGAVQRRGTADHLIERLTARPTERLDPPLRAALRLGLYELLFTEGAEHAAVDQAVELAKSRRGGRRGAGLVNAVLRRAVAERDELLASLEGSGPKAAAFRESYPRWLAELWWKELGDADALALMAAQNQPAETALRVNELRTSRSQAIDELRAAGTDAVPAPGPAPLDVPESLVVRGALGRAGGALLAGARGVAQSRASTAAVAVLDPRPTERVLDLCAGPGLKTTQIAARMEDRGELVSIELRPQRASQVSELAARLGATIVRAVAGDASEADLGGGYDRVLVDPPCSDLGTLASRPDARWRKEPADPERLAELQGRILARGAAALRPGGALVYSTCTISARENEDVVSRFLGAEGTRLGIEADDLGTLYPALSSPRDSRFLQTRPDRDGTDGFFIARLLREG